MYQVIARKYRPQAFAELIGQEHVRTTLENAIAQRRIAHGYIFSGQRGTGKTRVASDDEASPIWAVAGSERSQFTERIASYSR
jgi:replication-associated recombination protein RarA